MKYGNKKKNDGDVESDEGSNEGNGSKLDSQDASDQEFSRTKRDDTDTVGNNTASRDQSAAELESMRAEATEEATPNELNRPPKGGSGPGFKSEKQKQSSFSNAHLENVNMTDDARQAAFTPKKNQVAGLVPNHSKMSERDIVIEANNKREKQHYDISKKVNEENEALVKERDEKLKESKDKDKDKDESPSPQAKGA
jgi:hypothetical protein